MIFALALPEMALPAIAQQIKENEALVMRLIFDDCLRYVQDGHEPFDELETTVIATEDIAQLETLVGQGLLAISLKDSTYHAMWRIVDGRRTCMIAITAPELQKAVLNIRPTELVE